VAIEYGVAPWTARIVLDAQPSLRVLSAIADVSSGGCAEFRRSLRARIERGAGPTLSIAVKTLRARCVIARMDRLCRKFLHGRIGPFFDLLVHGPPNRNPIPEPSSCGDSKLSAAILTKPAFAESSIATLRICAKFACGSGSIEVDGSQWRMIIFAFLHYRIICKDVKTYVPDMNWRFSCLLCSLWHRRPRLRRRATVPKSPARDIGRFHLGTAFCAVTVDGTNEFYAVCFLEIRDIRAESARGELQFDKRPLGPLQRRLDFHLMQRSKC